MEGVEEYPILSQVSAGDIRAMLPPNPPDEGESFDRIMQDVDEIILPGIGYRLDLKRGLWGLRWCGVFLVG